MKKQTGFTLIELMITLVVLAVVATIATPAIQQIIARSAVTSATNDLVSALQVARSQAIREGERWEVSINTGSDPWLEVDSSDGGDDRRRNYTRNDTLSVGGINGGMEIEFDSRGMPTGGSELITLSWRGVGRCVAVSTAGRIRSGIVGEDEVCGN